jgi:hypothetical protein
VVEELKLQAGGLDGNTNEHLDWATPPVKVGDEIKIKIIKTDSPSDPDTRRRTDPAVDLERRKDYVRKMATELGWKLTEG